MRSGPSAAAGLGLSVAGGVATLTLDRPATRNRLDAGLMAAVADACDTIEDDPDVRVALVVARGPHFCAGLPDGVGWLPEAWPDGVAALARLRRPVIAALAGEASGWGLALALVADVRLAATTAVLRLDGASAGRLGGGGAIPRLARLVGPARAAELVLLERPLDARTALAWGLVSCLVPPARLRREAARLAATVAARAPLALALAKETVTRALDLPLDDGCRLEHDCYVLLQTTADRREGIDAFLAKRRPRFVGR